MTNQNKKIKSGYYTFWKCSIHEESNKTASFADNQKFQEKITFTHALWANSDQSK